MTYSPLTASVIRLVRPFDMQSHAALQQLATAFDACIRRGTLVLAGQPHPALLAVSPTGSVIVAVLLDAAESDSSSHHSPEGVTSDDHG